MFQEPEESHIPEDKIRELADRLEDEARKIGLYLAGIAVSVMEPSDEGPAPYVVQATFHVGSVAFSPRVQDPEQDKIEDEVRGMEHDFTQQQWDALREEYRRQREEGPEEL